MIAAWFDRTMDLVGVMDLVAVMDLDMVCASTLASDVAMAPWCPGWD